MERRTSKGSLTKRPPSKRSSIGWNNKALSDVVIRIIPEKPMAKKKKTDSQENIGIQEIHASKLLLVSQSKFFEKLFLNGMKETNQDKVDIIVDSDQVCYFVDMLQFMYTGKCEEDVLQVAMMADKYECQEVMTECAAILTKNLASVEEANRFLSWKDTMAHLESLNELFNACEGFIIDNFRSLQLVFENEKKRRDLESLNEHAMEAILTYNGLVVYSENMVYRVFEFWLDADREARSVHVPKLFAHIRIAKCSCAFFVENVIAKHPVIGNSQIFKDKMVKEMFAFGYDQDEWDEKTATGNPMFFGRTGKTAVTVFQWEFTVPNTDNNTPKSSTFWLDGFEFFITALYLGWRNSIQIQLHPAARMKKLAVQYSVYLRDVASRELDAQAEEDQEDVGPNRHAALCNVDADPINGYITQDGKMSVYLEFIFARNKSEEEDEDDSD